MKNTIKLIKKPLNLLEKLELEIVLVFVILGFGVIIMHRFEGLDRFDALYFSIITLAGIGYGDIVPTTIYGKILAMVYGIIGIPIFIIAGGLIVEIIKGRNKDD